MPKNYKDETTRKVKRIFYTNITYGCNSICLFCYSHNTKHSKVSHNEISKKQLVDYWNNMKVCSDDRVIINGGEPFIHSEIEDILLLLKRYNCEVLVYTNGRLLQKFDFSKLNKNFRFIIPIHGFEFLHDSITRVVGSYQEMIKGIHHLSMSECLFDIKIIINYEMVTDTEFFIRTKEAIREIPKFNSLHITKMADTIISQRNKCVSITSEMSSQCTKDLYESFKDKYTIKLFDTCIKDIMVSENLVVNRLNNKILVFFKDAQNEFCVTLEKPYLSCMNTCDYKDICQSAVGEYTVLEINGNIATIGLE